MPTSVNIAGSQRNHRRRGQPLAARLFEGAVLAGAAIGLLITVLHAANHHTTTAACHASASTCLGKATTSAAMPYLKAGLIGGLVGGILSLALIVLARQVAATGGNHRV